MNGAALRVFIGAVVAALVALFLAPLVPVAGHALTIIAWVVCGLLIVWGLYILVTGGRRTTL
jgi:hypothetical protein